MVHTRRSSRLQATPQRDDASHTPEPSTPKPVAATPCLPTLGESEEPADQPAPAATPQASNRAVTFLQSFMARTPKNQTLLKPSGEEMHPEHHHLSTAKPLDEARWLGFLNMGARTEPAKKGASKIPITQATPTKAQESTPSLKEFSTPEFKFRFRRQSLELSPEAQKLMEESRQEAIKIRAQMNANPEESGVETNEDIQRRIAKPKGKSTRFSDVHMAQFKKMDSIANHPSAFRADPNRIKAGNPALKRSPSKAELDKGDNSPAKLPRSRSTVSLNKPQEDKESGPAKRVKRAEGEDASAARPKEGQAQDGNPAAPKSGIPRFASKSNLMTPTKATIARSQSVKSFKKTTMIPMLSRSPSVHNLGTPSKPKAQSAVKGGLLKPNQTLSRLPSVKSILRSPTRHYSNDPAKIAAGTHVTTPPDFAQEMPDIPATEPVQKKVNFSDSTNTRMDIDMNDASEKEDEVEEPSEAAEPVAPEAPAEKPADITYPQLPSFGSPSRTATTAGAPGPGDFTFRSNRSISFGAGLKGVKGPTIRKVRSSDAGATLPKPFDSSDNAVTPSPKKRKQVNIPAGIAENEKENDDTAASEEEAARPAKRVKPSSAPIAPPKTPAKPAARKRTAAPSTAKPADKRGRAALSQARLNLLAQPKRRA
ncbi:uncharacterized protein K452DRAFT_64640 [Aplosporella prunicola CBS 121167]|uniref:Erythromycin esterase n=1 Tax=Aplosporella prunicola CBS 121167 TaxID=1176127 RepID=A0A6A6BB66_9PEZI|nr:uncharacterized protein K452DRAFT_64640 [Aplosporella prunicola CBS 121167]KAF2139721.1 hypothetical protein K452DRAFT_64640 [Aplosporella prunicola CBS 121167]